MMLKKPSFDIVRTTRAVLFIGILIVASFWILRPFLTALVWATMIVITTWPLMLGVQKRCRGMRAPAVIIMTLTLLLVFILPFTAAIISIVTRADEIAGWAKGLTAVTVPPAPDWLEEVPMVGPRLAAQWQHLAAISKTEISARLAPYAKEIVSWLAAQAGSVGMMIIQFLLTVIISAVLYASGDTAAVGVRRFALRLGGPSCEDATILAAKAVRGVALGVVVTAVLQSLLGGIGLALSGIPAAAILTAVMFVLCVAQLGPGLVLIPSVIWLFWQDQTFWGTIMIVWSVVVGTVDNFVRPFLIKKGADLPLLLIFAGVIGGLIAFGVIGLFVGPVILAVTYTLLSVWVSGEGPCEKRKLPEGGIE